MADTTHNVTIKATLDTSTNDNTNRSDSPSGIRDGSVARNYGTAIAGASFALTAFARTIQLGMYAFMSLTSRLHEFSIRLAQISDSYTRVNKYRFDDEYKKHLEEYEDMAEVAGQMSVDAVEKFGDILKKLYAEISSQLKKGEKADQAKVDSAKKVIRAQENQAKSADKAADSAKKQASAFETAMTNFMKWALISQAAGNLSRVHGDIASLTPTESDENHYKWYSRIGRVVAQVGTGAGAGAGIGAAAGSATGPGAMITTAGGAIIGGLFGLTTGILDEINTFTKETEDKTNELNDLGQSAARLAKSQSDMRKSIQKTIEKINRDIYDNVILETAPDQLESTLVTLEENILLITKDISELNSRFIQGKISLENYNETMSDMQGARNVLVSRGADGAVLLDENGRQHMMASPKGKLVNSVGAGDSMVAGFLAGYLKTQDYEEALRLGVAAGSASAFKDWLATSDDIDKIILQGVTNK